MWWGGGNFPQLISSATAVTYSPLRLQSYAPRTALRASAVANGAAASPTVESTLEGGLVLSGSKIVFKSAGKQDVDIDAIVALLESQSKTGEQLAALERRVSQLEAENIELKKATSTLDTGVNDRIDQVSNNVDVAVQAAEAVSKELDATVEDIGILAEQAEVTGSCLTDVSARVGGTASDTCGEGSNSSLCIELSDIDGGKVHGSGRGAGAARYYTCDEGRTLVGRSHTFCDKDRLEWIPSVPSCPPTVSCYMWADNFITGVFADGRKLTMELLPKFPLRGGMYSHQYTKVTFPATTRVLGIKAGDRELGCAGGSLKFACESSSRSPWHGMAGGNNRVQAFGSNDKDKTPRTTWATDDAIVAARWPQAHNKAGVYCFSQDEDYWQGKFLVQSVPLPFFYVRLLSIAGSHTASHDMASPLQARTGPTF